MKSCMLWVMVLGATFGVCSAAAADDSVPILVVHNNQFEPHELALPSGAKVKLTIRNDDDLPIEFESYDLSREIVIPAHGTLSIYIGPLAPGKYEFFNDFNHDMKGLIVAKPVSRKE